MITIAGFIMVGVILTLLLSQRVSPVVAFILVPITTALAIGYSPGEVSEFMGTGLQDIVGITAMFVFAILFFGVLSDAGMFDPIVRRILGVAGRNPVTIALATSALATVAHLDGAGATTALITIPAFLPIYKELGMSRLVLTTCVALPFGVMNMVPWGGPTVRAAAALGVNPNELWVPLIPAQMVGLLAAFAIAYYLGRQERIRLTTESPSVDRQETAEYGGEPSGAEEGDETQAQLARPERFWINITLTVVAIAVLISGIVPPEIVFMIALVLALLVNYPNMRMQTERVEAHSRGAIMMASILLAAGAFLGIFEETGMVEGMTQTTASIIPPAFAPLLPVIVGVMSVPVDLLFGPDAYYFGALPILAGTAEQFGISPIAVAQASMVGAHTVGTAVSPYNGSTFLVVGLAGVSLGAHIRHLLPWAFLVSLIILTAAILTGVIPLWTA